MLLANILAEKKTGIVKKWRDAVVKTYPTETQRFFKKEKNQFSNPVGHVIIRDLEILFDEVIKAGDNTNIASSLDNIIRIRAVQDFKSSQSLSFILQLKGIIREELNKSAPANGITGELQALEDRIDQMALIGFDVYSECRQKLYDIRVNEVKNQVGRLLEKANLISEIPNPKSNP